MLAGSGIKDMTTRRHDGLDMPKELNARGYDFIRKVSEIDDSAKKVVCIDEEMDEAATVDNIGLLADATRRAIAKLSNAAEDGFFMMVEGGKVDWAGHANDAATNLREVLALDDAVRVALDYQKAHPDTLIVTTGDHETGGMSMGFSGTGYSFHMDRLANQKCSSDRIGSFIRKNHPATFEALKPFLAENFGFDFEGKFSKDNPMALTKDELKELTDAFAHDLEMAKKGKKDDEAYDAKKISRLPTAVKSVFSHKCGIGWSSGAHTAQPVLTTAGGPGAERFIGLMENTDISRIMKELVK